MYSIYKYTNANNGKVYIGQTSKTLEERAQAGGRNYRDCRRFYTAIQEYSWDAFIPDILEIVATAEEADEREMYYIALYNSSDERFGYNLELGGKKDKIMNAESKEMISKKAIVRYCDPTANPMFGKKHSENTRRIISEKNRGSNNPMFGTTWTDTQRSKCGTRGKHLNLSDERRQELAERFREVGKTVGLRAVQCIEDNVRFRSITEAADHYGVRKSTLCGHLNGKQKSCCGKHFIYVDLEGATTIETTDKIISGME